ncbi:MAG: L,D-transpeptidase [Legionellales bacterium]|nr:L,D-transpeptidase [Legionellales bacterium]
MHQDGMSLTSGPYANQPQPNPTYSFPETRSEKGKCFIFDPKQAAWAAYDENGHLVKDGFASGGRDYCSDINSPCHTPTGVYHVYQKEGADCKSSIFPIGKGGAPMPYCMFFHGGFAVHGSYDVVPGQNVSHGCVRVSPADAEWLSQNFMNVGTTVVVEHY